MIRRALDFFGFAKTVFGVGAIIGFSAGLNLGIALGRFTRPASKNE
jgi:hypothetical protein